MKGRVIEIILHIIFWACTSWLLYGFSLKMRLINIIDGVEKVSIIRDGSRVMMIFSCIGVGLIMFYTTVWLALRANELRKKTVFFLLLVLATGICMAYLITVSTLGVKYRPLPLAITYGIVIFYFAVSIAYSIGKLFYRNHQRQQQLVLDKKNTELALLRNQLQPHFLFNALNNLLSLVKPTDNPKLVKSFERLSQLLRYVIEETKPEKVSVQKEITFLENYIELQKLRFTDSEAVVNLTVDGQFINQQIEPGMYITFVENAFKYGTEPEKISSIDIYFDLTKAHKINFKLKNKVMMPNLAGNKTGIESIRKRLNLIYPGRHQLTIEQSEYFIVNLNIETV